MYVTDSKNEKKQNYLNKIELYVMCSYNVLLDFLLVCFFFLL